MTLKKCLYYVVPPCDRVRCSCNPFKRSFEMIPSFYRKDGETITFTASWSSSVSNIRMFKIR